MQPLPAAARETCLLRGHLGFSALINPSADIRIFAFVVLANDREINFAGLPVLQGGIDALEQTHATQIGVLPKSSADRHQQSPKRNVIRYAGVADCAQKDRVAWP